MSKVGEKRPSTLGTNANLITNGDKYLKSEKGWRRSDGERSNRCKHKKKTMWKKGGGKKKRREQEKVGNGKRSTHALCEVYPKGLEGGKARRMCKKWKELTQKHGKKIRVEKQG